MESVRVRSIFNTICDAYEIGKGMTKSEKNDLHAGMISTLKNIFSVLLNMRLARDSSDFKPGGKENSPFLIPLRDKPIVYALLKSAVNPNPSEQDKLISDWLTVTGIPINDYDRIHDLHSVIYSILTDLETEDEIDDVTREEWMRAIDINIGFDKAIAIMKSIDELEYLMKWATVLDVPGNNEIIINGENGSRQNWRFSNQYMYDVNNRPINQIAEECVSLDEFSLLLQSVYISIRSVIVKKAIRTLYTIAKFSLGPDMDHITNAFQTSEQVASEYYTYYRNIYQLLNENPKICSDVESEANIKDLLNFLRIDPQLPNYLNKEKNI